MIQEPRPGEGAEAPALVTVENLSFAYQVDQRRVDVLKNVSFQIAAGDYVAIQGPSGSGKSTLFYILGCMLEATSGRVRILGQDLAKASDAEAAYIRNRRIGFVFQQFHLLPRATVLDNILLPCQYPAELPDERRARRDRAVQLATRLGLADHLEKQPNQLSGGQQQRVAIARALIHDVDLILADEPTGNLDSQNAQEILQIFDDLNRQGKTIVIITHDPEVAARARSSLLFRDGRIVHEEHHPRGEGAAAPFAQGASSPPSSGEGRGPAAGRSVLPKAWRSGAWRLGLAAVPAAVANLVRSRAKSVLTMLGVVVGIAAVLAMISLGQFAKRRIVEGFEALGVNKLVVRGYPNWEREATDVISLEFQAFDWDKDLAPLRRIFPEIRLLSPVLTNWQNAVTAGGRTISEGVRLVGVNHEYLAITNAKIAEGRNFTPHHVTGMASVCVLGQEIADKLLTGPDRIGSVVNIVLEKSQTLACTVVGILQGQKSSQEWSKPNMQVLIPYTVFQTVGNWWTSRIYEISLQVREGRDVEQTARKVEAFFGQKYGESARIMVDSEGTLVAQTKRFLNIFSALLAAIAFLSLFVGGIGIHNMMLVSVTERLKEIGLRKALGATSKSLKLQILVESVVLCGVAGLVGLLAGLSATALMIFAASKLVPNLAFEWVIDPWAIAISVGSIIVVGILSGSVPARRAEKLQIIESLRAE